jgi:imidazolonepropionase-like amidohydrolase
VPVSWIASARIAAPHADRVAVALDGPRILEIASQPPRGADVFDASGQLLLPAFTDAHVHLAIAADLRTESEALLRGGVAAVLDLGAPERLVPSLIGCGPLQVAFAGPLLTAPRGYPTQSWGANGYGLEIASENEARKAVARVAAVGARVVKLALDARFPVLDAATARAAADEAHRRGLLVAAHALEPDLVRLAVEVGVDVLAHAPSGTLPDDLVREIGTRRLRVIATLHAYRGEGIENLRRLREAGAIVAYGTDLGNEGISPGIDAEELSLLSAAGLSAGAILDAVHEAALLAGIPGTITRGARADLMLVPEEALAQPVLLAQPSRIWIAGAVRRGEASAP